MVTSYVVLYKEAPVKMSPLFRFQVYKRESTELVSIWFGFSVLFGSLPACFVF